MKEKLERILRSEIFAAGVPLALLALAVRELGYGRRKNALIAALAAAALAGLRALYLKLCG